MDLNIEDFAYGVLMEARPSIPADVLEVIADDMAAGEFFTSLIELVERAPQVVSASAVDALAAGLELLPESAHRRVGVAAVACFGRLERA